MQMKEGLGYCISCFCACGRTGRFAESCMDCLSPISPANLFWIAQSFLSADTCHMAGLVPTTHSRDERYLHVIRENPEISRRDFSSQATIEGYQTQR